jgi:hypothetical protein
VVICHDVLASCPRFVSSLGGGCALRERGALKRGKESPLQSRGRESSKPSASCESPKAASSKQIHQEPPDDLTLIRVSERRAERVFRPLIVWFGTDGEMLAKKESGALEILWRVYSVGRLEQE